MTSVGLTRVAPKSWIARTLLCAIFSVLLFAHSYWNDHHPVFAETLFLSAIVLAGLATAGRFWSTLYLAGYKTHRLVVSGPYSMCRNPVYFYTYVGLIGVGLASETVLVPLIVALVFAVYYSIVINSEEAKLLMRHHQPFLDYCRRIPRFVPSWLSFSEPSHYIVRPKLFRQKMIDSAWFVLVLGILHYVATLHDHGVLPNLFVIY